MTFRWTLLAAFPVACVALGTCTVASIREDEQLRRLPTHQVEVSKKFGVFAGSLDVFPKTANLDGTNYQIAEVWLESRSKPRRISLFYTHQEIFPDKILCVRVTPFTHQDPQIKDAVTSHIHVSGAGFAEGNVIYTEVGVSVPDSFILCGHNGGSETLITIKKRPNQAPLPTPVTVTPAAGAPVAPATGAAEL